MKNLSILMVLMGTLLLQSCVTVKDLSTIIPEQTAAEIPLNANKIIIANDSILEENYYKSYKILLAKDYHIAIDNNKMGYILASKKDFGDTYVRLSINCSKGLETVTSEWKPGNESVALSSAIAGRTMNFDWEKAQWNKKVDKSSVAFAKAVTFSKELSNNLVYKTP